MLVPRRPAAVPALAVAVPGVAAVALAAAVVTEASAATDPLVERMLVASPVLFGLVALVHGALGSAAVVREPSRRLGVTACALSLLWSLDTVLHVLALTTGSTSPLLFWPLDVLTTLGAVSTSTLLVLFPDGRFLPGRWGAAGRVYLVAIVVVGVLLALCPVEISPVPDVSRTRPDDVAAADPTVVPWLADLVQPVLGPLVLAATAWFAVALLTAAHRYRRSTGSERDHMRWVVWGGVVLVLIMLVSVVANAGQIDTVLGFAIVTVNAVSMTLAVLDPSWVSIEDLLVRTLVYGGLGVLLVGLDLAVVAGLTALLDDTLDQREVVLIVLLLTAVLYAPLRERLTGLARRAVRGDRETPYDAVAGLATALETTDDGEQQLAEVAVAVAGALGVGFVSVEVDRPGGDRLVATHGRPSGPTRSLPIRYRDDVVGRLVLPGRGLRSHLDRRSERLLGDLVRQAATFARSSRLAEELRHNRERLVVAREDERRRIRRDLHDDLAPTLGGLVFQVESASVLVEADPDTARARIAETTAHLQDLVAHVRRLVHDLRPPVLDDRGLVGALRQQAEHLASADPELELEVEVRGEVAALPAAVEVAAYRIVEEALDNVGRHARARRCSVTLRPGPRSLVVEVADDGVGIPADVQAGAGLTVLRERAGELGGSVAVSCPDDGGTVLRATIPVVTP